MLGSQSQGLTVVELAGAYSIFNDGKFTTPHYWTEMCIRDSRKKVKIVCLLLYFWQYFVI